MRWRRLAVCSRSTRSWVRLVDSLIYAFDWRFFVVFRPFQKHILFYEVAGEDVLMRRAMHGHRDLLQRLLQPPGAN